MWKNLHLPFIEQNNRHNIYQQRPPWMNIKQFTQKCITIQQPLPLTLAQPLWKRVNSKSNVNRCQFFQPLCMKDEISAQEEISNLSRFLAKTHNRISESYCGTESEIMEKLSIDWEEESGEYNLCQQKSFDSSKQKIKRKSFVLEQQTFVQLKELKESKNLQQFIGLLANLNPLIHAQMLQVMEQKQKLAEERNNLFYKQTKMEVQVKLLESEVEILSQKNMKIMEDFERVKKEVSIKNISMGKQKLELEKRVQEIREDYERKLRKMNSDFETSTRYSFLASNGIQDEITFNQHQACDPQQKDDSHVFKESSKVLNMSVEFKKQKDNEKHIVQRQKSKAMRIENDLENMICRIIKPSAKSLGLSIQASQRQ